MGLVYTFTRTAIAVNQPLSLGSAKAFVGELDVTSYLSPVTIVPADVGLTSIHAIIPVGTSDQQKIIKHAAGQAANVFKAFAQADGTTEVANDADAGMWVCLIIGS